MGYIYVMATTTKSSGLTVKLVRARLSSGQEMLFVRSLGGTRLVEVRSEQEARSLARANDWTLRS